MTGEAAPTTPTVTISLTVKDAGEALDFYTRALGANELFRMCAPDGSVMHAEFTIGNSLIFLSGESPDWHAFAMPEGATASCNFSIDTEGCDDAFKKAVDAGAEALVEPQDYFWGRRTGVVKDPYGYRWSLSQFIEEVSPEEIERRAKEMFAKGE